MLTSMTSTVEALALIQDTQAKAIPLPLRFTSELFSNELQNLINNNTAGPETIATFIMDEIEDDQVLEYSEVVDMKMAFFALAGLVTIMELEEVNVSYSSLHALYAKAFSV